MAASEDFTGLLAAWIAGKTRQWHRRLFDSYRPELHYMRGPGPKWREKHGQAPVAAAAGLHFPQMTKAGVT